ncbi:Ubiquitin carboxyl-terminal hydrolase [Metarhizium anisopliae BRIP 53293]|uniref:Ubiquitin carboxyl-terminal hydrolase n=1 Tax=Metarhizium anisopliae BRIP 53293 TaxID=1291518 RepID=A0A0D9NJ33_METAN|nr:Ubiquitin carboxyl-terminal hydrolase [Metarhizium anisopliae BRIP 53293]KJK87515.1 Ubiquitin carboxyl-terminal hydrolase 6 [Metarhizium anisopliae BRIP 53284]
MASLTVVVKHQGKKYDVEIDPSSTGEDFKLQLFSLTNVEPERQKILIKGGQLKDDADMTKLGLKPNQVIMMMGTPGSGGGDLVRPKDSIKFVEDMTEAEQAQQVGATPAGLVNLGNTCYLNSTLQTLRSIPELQTSLQTYKPNSSGLMAGMASADLASQLASLYKKMSETQDAFPPMNFLTALRVVFPQFAEKAKSNNGYAQQDAEEAWSQIVQQLSQKVKIKESDDAPEMSFVDKYMSGEFSSTLECDEEEARNGGEQVMTSKDQFYKLNCHIDGSTNHLRDGILAALSEKLEKKSDVLGRDATYTKKSKISRAPKYLTVHFVRFFWKRETQKKAKIMRKVTFPQELDIVEFCSDELKKALIPVRDKVREVRKDEEDIERARKRRKKNNDQDVGDIPGGAGLPSEREKKEKKEKEAEKKPQTSADGDTEMGETFKTDAEIDAEKDAALLAAKKELNSLIDPALRNDDGANQSGLYELRGVVTHQGASADSGHYTSYVKKSAPIDPKTGEKGEEDGKWWWFNDDKVTEVTVDKVEALAGGGESHSALILLYKAVPLPSSEGTME